MRGTHVMLLAAIGWAILGSGCRKADRSKAEDEAAAAAKATAEAKTEEATADAPAKAHAKSAIPWIHDDYAGALAKARESELPLVIDMWAPWCHTCLSMQTHVFTEPALAPLAERFVWLALDTDKESSAKAVAALPVPVWPTFYVVTPGEGEALQVQARHMGAASLSQFREFLSQGEKGHLDTLAKGGDLPEGSPLALLRAADRAVVAGDLAAAEEAYTAALEAGGMGWKRRPEVLVSLVRTRFELEDWAGCVELGQAELGRLPTPANASVSDFAYYAAICAQNVDGEAAAALLQQATRAVKLVLAASDSPLSFDDRSEAMRILREIYVARGREDDARALAEEQRALLDQATAEAPNAFVAMTYMWPRTEVYAYLGRSEELIPEFEKMVEALPDQYDPSYRLAGVLLRAGRHDEALAAANKALSMVYGPRKARVQEFIAEIHADRGDREAERAARAAVVEIFESLPPGHAPAADIEAARAALAALEQADR